MKIYEDYINEIKNAMSGHSHPLNESREFNSFEKSYLGESGREINNEVLPSLSRLSNLLQHKPKIDQNLGLHPDFMHLKGTERLENHYIVSMFVDVKNSTNLFKKYDPQTVFHITNTIQKAAIHTFLIFGGYIHRLQGDGLFIYFGGKNIDIQHAVKQSLISASVFSYFMRHDLKKLFTEQGIESIFTRIGVDLGYDNDVVWGNAGNGNISEVTTCSLHTSLASKMQSNAESNGIVFGENIKANLKNCEELITPVCKRTNNVNDRYIFTIPEKNFLYTQYDYNWYKFLKQQDFIVTDLEGNMRLKNPDSRDLKNLRSIAIQNKPYYQDGE